MQKGSIISLSQEKTFGKTSLIIPLQNLLFMMALEPGAIQLLAMYFRWTFLLIGDVTKNGAELKLFSWPLDKEQVQKYKSDHSKNLTVAQYHGKFQASRRTGRRSCSKYEN